MNDIQSLLPDVDRIEKLTQALQIAEDERDYEKRRADRLARELDRRSWDEFEPGWGIQRALEGKNAVGNHPLAEDVQAALRQAWTERDEARAEVGRLRAERTDLLKSYCSKLTQWFRLMQDREQERHPDEPRKRIPYRSVLLNIRKSNLLARTLYDGQPLRTEKCPIHAGKWSGIHWDSVANKPAQCPHRCGSDRKGLSPEFTGWTAPEATP